MYICTYAYVDVDVDVLHMSALPGKQPFWMARQSPMSLDHVQVNLSNAAWTRCDWPTDASTTASMLPSTGGRQSWVEI